MKITYDHQIFLNQKYGGISRYYYELASRIVNSYNIEVDIIAPLYINKYLQNSSQRLVKGSYFPFSLNPKFKKAFDCVNFQSSKILLNKSQPNIVHETYYSRQTIAPRKSKIVITVYDMIHEKFADLRLSQNLINAKSEAIKRADHVICISENTKKDLIDILDIKPKKISIIYLGYSLQNNINLQAAQIINHPYILYVGERRPEYKNFKRLLYAYANSQIIKENFYLVCCSSESFSKTEMEMIHKLGVRENCIIHMTADDSILANLYTYASALVYPSLYEGFGIPPLEAMYYGCPVVCSDVSSIPEVVKNAGEYFNPYEIDSIIDSLQKILFSNKRTQELINMGKERLKYFSWDKCAEEHLIVYRSLL